MEVGQLIPTTSSLQWCDLRQLLSLRGRLSSPASSTQLFFFNLKVSISLSPPMIDGL
jgi:hypothetical protein